MSGLNKQRSKWGDINGLRLAGLPSQPDHKEEGYMCANSALKGLGL
jgi:hypothetical protein